MRITSRQFLCCALLMGLALGPAASASAGELGELAKFIPADTLMYMVIPDCRVLARKLQETSLFALYKEPALQQLIGPAKQKILESIKEQIESGWRDRLGIADLKNDLPWPQGFAADVISAIEARALWSRFGL